MRIPNNKKLYRIARIIEKYLSDGNDSIILKNGTFLSPYNNGGDITPDSLSFYITEYIKANWDNKDLY